MNTIPAARSWSPRPELLIAAAAERTTRVRLGTGVVSLPYHHPFQVAKRMVQLTHLTAISPYA